MVLWHNEIEIWLLIPTFFMPLKDMAMIKSLVVFLIAFDADIVQLCFCALFLQSMVFSFLNICIRVFGVSDMKAQEIHYSFLGEEKILEIILHRSSLAEKLLSAMPLQPSPSAQRHVR